MKFFSFILLATALMVNADGLWLTTLQAMPANPGPQTKSIQSESDHFVHLLDGGKLYYEEYGQGTPVILVHGHTLDHRMWRTQIAPLAKHFRVITPDMRGYGRSSRQSDTLQFIHADDLIEFMDSLHISKAHLVGLSMGGFITADILCMYPERLLSAVMASGWLRNHPGPSVPLDSAEIGKQQAAIDAVLAEGIQHWKDNWIDRLIKGGGTRAESIRSELSAQVNDWDCYQLLHIEGRHYYATEAMPSLEQKRPGIPVLFLSGEKEHKRPPVMMKHLPNAQFKTLNDCGHMSNMEQPEAFNQILTEFLHAAEVPGQ